MNLPKSFVQELYDEVAISIKFSLTMLLLNSEFKNNINTLRKEGWFDWQILSAVKMLILGYRNRGIHSSDLTAQQKLAEVKRQSKEGEREDDVEVPLEVFNLKDLRNTLILAKKDLKRRYKFDKIDVAHVDYFDLERIANL